ncbi:hypothetical protein [uncultured Paracoccus sp.]|uniref:hypothetical protein n=1 Tax=uncultured Paracoccus sp. TaxID=189685 RepID=UPI00260D507A|nr:hypothetical protein [uncultured Paracoccus sp.]
MIHSCIGLEFLNDRELYVLTTHKEGEEFESRIFGYDIETGAISLMFIFENWIKRFAIIGKEAVWASQWDDSIYMTSADADEHYHLTVGCITDFKLLPDGGIVVVGLDGAVALLSADRRPSSVPTRIDRDILYCLPGAGGIVHGCGARGLYFEMNSDRRVDVTDLQTNCFLTSLCLSPSGDLLVSGRGILMKKKGAVVEVIAEGTDFYDAIWRNDSFYVCAGTKGIKRIGAAALTDISDVPSYCIAQTESAIAAGGLDAFTIYRDGERRRVPFDRDFLTQIQV